MPDKTACARCRNVRFIRLEKVLRADHFERHYYCGSCEHLWVETDDGTPGMTVSDEPDRSRTDQLPTPTRKAKPERRSSRKDQRSRR
jgi:hypothetical protein